jgi:2',3'-cyclic-nucleotide 2'-phosphodiesterase (5'-nucleotidase family)
LRVFLAPRCNRALEVHVLRFWFPLVALALLCAPPAALATGSSRPAFAPIGSYETGLGLESAEIVAYEDGRMFVTNSARASLDIVDVSDPSAPSLIRRVDLSAFGSSVTCVSAHRGLVAVAVPAEPRTSPGKVLILDRDGKLLDKTEVGALPDMLTFSADGMRLLVANEGEPSQDYSIDPQGSVSVLFVWPFKPFQGRILHRRTIGFGDFDAGQPRHAELPAGIRITGPGASVSQDLEPEYISVSPDLLSAFVTLQENNAVAVIDLLRLRVRSIHALGTKDHSLESNGFDPSDRDSSISIGTWPVRGMYQPDGIAAFATARGTYYITANEGDARAYDGFAEDVRVGSSGYVLDSTVFPNASALKSNARLGRLTVTRASGDLDGDGDFDEIQVFGARSFSIHAADGRRVFDSGDALERLTAATFPANFNSNNDTNDFDSRSDNKGPEPEGVTVGRIGPRTYAFIGLERIGGVLIYDVTDPLAPIFVQYTNNRDFGSDPVGPDSGPEGLVFVDAFSSPTHRPLLLVSNEISGTVTLYEARDPDGADQLTLLHNNDGESTLLPLLNSAGGVQVPVAGVAAFKSVTDRELRSARALRQSALNVYAGDAFLASSTLACSLPPNPPTTPVYDALAQRQIAYDAHILGNHEFDFSPDFLERFIRGFRINGVLAQPFLSANLDFSAEPGFANLIAADGLLETGGSTDGRVVARSAIAVDRITGSRYGIVGATTPTLPTISSPRNVAVTTVDLVDTAAVVQREIDRLRSLGVRKLILVSHLQDVANDRALVRQLAHVDVAVAGGGDELLASPAIPDADELLPGETQPIQGTYPLVETDALGRSVYIVTTSGNYKYLGRADLVFDDAGEVREFVPARSYPRRVVLAGAAASAVGIADAVAPDAALIASVDMPVEDCLADLSQPIATTEILLNVSRSGVSGVFATGNRSGETNAGNLIADGFLDSYDRYAPLFGLPPRGPGNPVIAVQNGGGIRQNAGDLLPVGGLVPGPITRRNTLDVLAFLTNAITVVSVSPSELEAILERSVAAIGGGQFLQIGGFRIEADLSRSAQVVLADGTISVAGDRIREVVLDDGTPIISGGTPVVGAPDVRIVTNSFTAAGGDNYPTLAAIPDKVQFPATYEQALVEYLLGFPMGPSGLPTIAADDSRYATSGAGRIAFVTP